MAQAADDDLPREQFRSSLACVHAHWDWRGKGQRYCLDCDDDLPASKEVYHHNPYVTCCGDRSCLQCYPPDP
jgi:hypothetical protein